MGYGATIAHSLPRKTALQVGNRIRVLKSNSVLVAAPDGPYDGDSDGDSLSSDSVRASLVGPVGSSSSSDWQGYTSAAQEFLSPDLNNMVNQILDDSQLVGSLRSV